MIKRAALIVGLLYVGALLIPGFFLHHAADTESFVVSADYHYGLVYGSALHVAGGETLSALRVNFGLLSTVTAGWLARLFGIDTFAGWIWLTQSFQALFLLCAVAGAWALRRDSRIVLVVLFAIAPFASTVNPFVLNPNISGFRFLCFALLPIVLAGLKQREGLSGALIGGGAAALFTLWNSETGVACSAAIFFYLFASEIAAGKTPFAAVPVVAAAGLIALLLVVAVLVGIAGTEGLPRFLAHLSGHAQAGYNGHLFDQWSLAALAFAFYASALVIYCCLRVREGSGDRDLVARAALAVCVIVWFAYYAHNAFYYVLWIYLFLLLLTVGPTLAARRGATTVATLVVIACNVAVLRVIPGGFTTASPTIQGLVLPAVGASYLQQHADRLRSVPEHGVFYFVSTPFITAVMTKRFNDLSIFDLFGETWTQADFDQLMGSVKSRHPALILIESEDSPILNSPRRQFLQRIRRAIQPTFSYSHSEGGFEFWREGPGRN